MRKKIVGMLIILILTLMPIISSEKSQISAISESEKGNITFFFIGMVDGIEEYLSQGSFVLKLFGIYKDMDLVLSIGENGFLFVDGELKHIESSGCLRIYDFYGFGLASNQLWITLKLNIFPPGLWTFYSGICESYQIESFC